ncbi:unnamed protein product [Caenorhabditis angaria]|uniref:C-type lectin domain-containing protein n=1 Tax=Caenorhabditis angaria TaxID=860376 RepID=A0A9P1J4T4_9PELO|nr:unnamed protein product [Caenorhabditis angaria]
MKKISLIFVLLTLAYCGANYKRVKLFNWNYSDLNKFEHGKQKDTRQPFADAPTNSCEDGWVRYSDSCYWIEKSKLSFADAEKECYAKNATLMVVNSQDEWTTVRKHHPNIVFYWIGLVRLNHLQPDGEFPVWQTEGAVHPAQMNWLVEPYEPVINGWSRLANCVAHFTSIESWNSSYLYYYPCSYSFNSICERNNTILDFLARKFDIQ